MLHRIVQAGCAAGLHRLVQVQREMLAFACNPAFTLPPDKLQVDAHFGPAADWVWDRLWNYGNPAKGASELQRLLVEAREHVRARPGLDKAVLDAFDHDRTFAEGTDNAHYAFAFWGLPEDTAKAVGGLARLFYALLSKGVPGEVHGGTTVLSVRSFKEAFWKSNKDLRACPACDDSKPDASSAGEMSDADHFFPASRYPFLSVHPRNLVPVCMGCNRHAKLDRDPIRDRNHEPMRSTFHPYALAAREHVEFRVERAPATNDPAVVVEEKGQVTSRVQGMIDLWDLPVRWKSRLPEMIEMVQDIVADMALDHDHPVGREEFRAGLDKKRLRRVGELGRRAGRILECAYLEYVLAEPAELNTYYKLYLDKQNHG